jgi:hypothetical protein
MDRELPRTLHSVGPHYQRGVGADEYEVIVVDNGSPEPVEEALVRRGRCDPGSRASTPRRPHRPRPPNLGIELAEGELVGLLIDGARIASRACSPTLCLPRASPSAR